MIRLKFEPRIGIWAEDPDSVEKLIKNFFGEEKGTKLDLWIDVKSMIPRRLFVDFEGGNTIREIFDDLPEPLKVTPALFDPKNLNVMLTSN